MININDYNRKDLIASCLMEAANIMTESYGKHGEYDRALQERLKTLENSPEAKKIEQYKKEGNEDNLPVNLKRFDKRIQDVKKDIAIHKRLRYTDNDREFSKEGPQDKMFYGPGEDRFDIGDKMYDAELRNRVNESKVNRKINDRAKKAMGESVESHLAFADAILDLLDD